MHLHFLEFPLQTWPLLLHLGCVIDVQSSISDAGTVRFLKFRSAIFFFSLPANPYTSARTHTGYVPVVSVELGVRGVHRADRAADPCCRSAADTDHIWLPVSARAGSVVRRLAKWAGLLAESHRCWMVVVYRLPLRSSAVGARRVWPRGGRSRLSSFIRPHSCRASYVVAS
jgi:hypothetical protein